MRDDQKTAFARRLRRDMTRAERRLWRELRMRQLDGHRFRRQVPLGPYVVDFLCIERRLVVEVDGGQHLDSGGDRRRDAFLAAAGYRVLRFWNHDVLCNPAGVVQAIGSALGSGGPHPSPSGQLAEPAGVRRRADQWSASAPPHPPQAGEGA
jgi:very-short-patch-repair endonuclease